MAITLSRLQRCVQFGTHSLDKLRSANFNLLSDQEYSEEEEAEATAETMEQYMSKTRTDYGSGVARPKIDNKDQFELKGQFLKELQENTFSGSDNEDVNEHIEKVLEIVDLFHVPNITVDQLMLRVFLISLTGAISRTARKIEEVNNFQQKPVETLFQAWECFKELLMKCSQHYLTEMQEEYYRKGFEKAIPSSTETNPRDQSKLISTTVEADSHPIRHIGSPQYAVSDGQNRASISVMPLLTYINLGLGELALTRLTVELADRTVKYSKGIAENILVGSGKFTFPIGFIILDMLEDTKVPLILERPFLSTAQSKIDVFKEARLMGETLVLNRSLDPFLEDYIEMNDLNEPIELRRNQEDYLMPTIEEGEDRGPKEFGIEDFPCCVVRRDVHLKGILPEIMLHVLKNFLFCWDGHPLITKNFPPWLFAMSANHGVLASRAASSQSFKEDNLFILSPLDRAHSPVDFL
ncbi:reverse transcriptase domain-containing protein [Tanacetum coccineum]|uniref:Reverse transcriptase domain-containing protein n=1 Tax=Tanacetum coccineum TaxID=301880 RepID=A0ABQ5IMM0_9ASTR